MASEWHLIPEGGLYRPRAHDSSRSWGAEKEGARVFSLGLSKEGLGAREEVPGAAHRTGCGLGRSRAWCGVGGPCPAERAPRARERERASERAPGTSSAALMPRTMRRGESGSPCGAPGPRGSGWRLFGRLPLSPVHAGRSPALRVPLLLLLLPAQVLLVEPGAPAPGTRPSPRPGALGSPPLLPRCLRRGGVTGRLGGLRLREREWDPALQAPRLLWASSRPGVSRGVRLFPLGPLRRKRQGPRRTAWSAGPLSFLQPPTFCATDCRAPSGVERSLARSGKDRTEGPRGVGARAELGWAAGCKARTEPLEEGKAVAELWVGRVPVERPLGAAAGNCAQSRALLLLARLP